MKIRTNENYTKMRRILISVVFLCLLYGGLRFLETMLFSGNPVIGYGALAGGAAMAFISFSVYLLYPHPIFYPLFSVTLAMVAFISISVHMQAIEFHYFVMLLGMAFISSLRKYKLPLIFAVINIGATVLVFTFAALGSLPWLDSFRFFTQFSLFLYGSFFIIWQTRHIEKNENVLEESIQMLKRREAMLTAINEMAAHLLSHETEPLDEVMRRGLTPVADVAALDRIAVYKPTDDGSWFGQTYLWFGKEPPQDEELRFLPFGSPMFRWFDYRTRGSSITYNVKDRLEEDEAVFLSKYGIKSIYFVPILTADRLWGAVTLEDHTNHRRFDEDNCIDLLQSAAHLCTSAVIREEMKNEIYKKESDLETAKLNEQKLANENAVLDKMHRMKTEFLQDIKHEMRNPLHIISLSGDYIRRCVEQGDENEEAFKTIDAMQNEALRLGQMINSMVELATMSGKTSDRKKIDFTEMLNRRAEIFRLELKQVSLTSNAVFLCQSSSMLFYYRRSRDGRQPQSHFRCQSLLIRPDLQPD